MFYDNFLKQCNKIGKSPSAVALEIGISKAVVNRWKNGSTPTDSTALRVADYFGISVGVLTGEEEQKNKPTDNGELSRKDIQLVNWFRSLPKETRQAILTLGAAPKGLDD